jgi:hypothetical protein
LNTYKYSVSVFFGWSTVAYAALQMVVALVVTGGALSAQQIRGRVLSADGNQPISAAAVTLVSGEVWATTNASGTYIFTVHTGGTYLVEAGALGARSFLTWR